MVRQRDKSAENAGGGDRTHTFLRLLDFESSDLSQACHWQPGIHFPLTIRRVFQGSRASRAICRPERIGSGLSSLPASGLQCSGRHPPLGGRGPQRNRAANLITRCENFCAKNSRGAADNVRQSHLWSRFVGGKRNYQLFCFQVNS